MTRSLRRAAVAAIVAAAGLRLVRGGMASPIGRYVVDGPSMLPAYQPGERLLVNRLAYAFWRPAIGDVVVLRDPDRRGHLLLKRVSKAPDGFHPEPSHVFVLGDNAAESRDSRAFGPVHRRAVIGKAWFKY